MCDCNCNPTVSTTAPVGHTGDVAASKPTPVPPKRKPQGSNSASTSRPAVDQERLNRYVDQASSLSDAQVAKLAKDALESHSKPGGSKVLTTEEFNLLGSDDLDRQREGLALAFYHADQRTAALKAAKAAERTRSAPRPKPSPARRRSGPNPGKVQGPPASPELREQAEADRLAFVAKHGQAALELALEKDGPLKAFLLKPLWEGVSTDRAEKVRWAIGLVNRKLESGEIRLPLVQSFGAALASTQEASAKPSGKPAPAKKLTTAYFIPAGGIGESVSGANIGDTRGVSRTNPKPAGGKKGAQGNKGSQKNKNEKAA